MIKSIIAGAGGFGLEVLQIMQDIGDYDVVGFLDPQPEKEGARLENVPILGGDERLHQLMGEGISTVAVAIAEGSIRKRLLLLALELGYHVPTLIHPMTYIAPNVSLGCGSVVYPGVTIMPAAELSDSVLVNAGVTLGHGVKVGSYSNINPGANVAGNVIIGERVLVGIGATILENLQIGDEAKIGAGAVVIRDVPECSTVVGVPASQITRPEV